MKISSKLMNINMAVNGYTLIQLAEVSKVSRATLSAVRNGKSCSYNTAAKIAKALNLDVVELIESEV